MSRTVPPTISAGSGPALASLREPDVSGLALWSAMLVASSALLAFLATEPAHAWPGAAPASASTPDGPHSASAVPNLPADRSPLAARETEADREGWH